MGAMDARRVTLELPFLYGVCAYGQGSPLASRGGKTGYVVIF